MNYLAASSGVSNVIPCLTEPARYLIRGNPVRFSGFRLPPEWRQLRQAAGNEPGRIQDGIL